LLEPTLVTRLAGVVADSPLAAAIATRAEATRQAEASARALFDTVDAARLSPRERYAFALATAETHADATLVAHYGERLAAAGGAPREDARFGAALRHARRVPAGPVGAHAAGLGGRGAAGGRALRRGGEARAAHRGRAGARAGRRPARAGGARRVGRRDPDDRADRGVHELPGPARRRAATARGRSARNGESGGGG